MVSSCRRVSDCEFLLPKSPNTANLGDQFEPFFIDIKKKSGDQPYFGEPQW
jgi:hypothetical protein